MTSTEEILPSIFPHRSARTMRLRSPDWSNGYGLERMYVSRDVCKYGSHDRWCTLQSSQSKTYKRIQVSILAP